VKVQELAKPVIVPPIALIEWSAESEANPDNCDSYGDDERPHDDPFQRLDSALITHVRPSCLEHTSSSWFEFPARAVF
jgi:hypothetical protein